jgi:tetratricopeptide (TPR) repeat protein
MTARSPERRNSIFVGNRGWIAVVIAATLAAYLPAFRAGWIWDDDHHVTENIQLRTLHGLRELWLRPGAVPQYYPVTHTTFWIEYHLWGLHPFGYHFDNCLLHIANAILVGLILRRLAVPGYAIAAAIFALHPIEVESVAWVTERKNVLSGLFYLLALWRALNVWTIAPSEKRGRFGYLICLGFFVLALLSKSVTASLPAIILLLIWWKRRRIRAIEIISLLPFFAAGAAMGSVTAWMERSVVGAAGSQWNWTVYQRILIAGRAVWFYLGKLIWPHPLSFVYHRWDVNPSDAGQWLYPILLIVLLVTLMVMRRRGLLTAAIFFIVTLVPALGFVNVYPMRYSFVADHFQYLAGIGPIAVAGACLARWKIALPILLILPVLTWCQCHAYFDNVTLWRDVVAKDDQSEIGHTNLAAALLTAGQLGAEAEAERALEAGHDLVESRVELGVIAEAHEQFDDARRIFQQAETEFPDSPLPYWELGILERRLGRVDQARGDLLVAAKYLPTPAPAYEQLGELELKRNNPAQAAQFFDEALKSDPDRVDAHNNLAAIDLGESSYAAAEQECRMSLAIDPDNTTACNNLGVALARQGRTSEARQCFQRALEIDPSFSEASENLKKLAP